MPTPVAHFELWSDDPARLSAFYQRAFDWTIDLLQEMNYHAVRAEEGGIGGGLMRPQRGPWPGNMSFYIKVDDLDAYKRRIVDAGGTIIVERQEVPDVGVFALFEDPDKRVLGIWQA